VRPGRDNIAAPDLPGGMTWVGAEPESMPALTAGGPALVHFLDFAQLNSVRTLPYLNEWSRRYREAGLSVIGIQSPRFPFGTERAAVAPGLAVLGVEFPEGGMHRACNYLCPVVRRNDCANLQFAHVRSTV